MTCLDAKPYVSTLYDGETVPHEAATHINQCPECRGRLRIYSEMGAELRLIAGLSPPEPLAAKLRHKLKSMRQDQLRFLRRRISMPRFAAVALLAGLLAAIPVSWTVVRAQNRLLWFQFDLEPKSSRDGQEVIQAAKAGYDEQQAWMMKADRQEGQSGTVAYSRVGARLAVKSVEDDAVQIEVAAREFGDGQKIPTRETMDYLDHVRLERFTFVPGTTLEIPIEGGGSLLLRGAVVDHQPKFAWGSPLELGPNQLAIKSPILIEGNNVVADFQGMSKITSDEAQTIELFVPNAGRFLFGLGRFPGAVSAAANWGQCSFRINRKTYTLSTGAPISGGEQPRQLWVALEPAFAPIGALKNSRGFLGYGPRYPKP